MTVCIERAVADGSRIEDGPLSNGAGRRARSAPASGLLAEPASILPVRAAAGPWIARVVRGDPPAALLRSVLPIARSELDFKLVDLVPLGFGSLPLRYGEKLLQALSGRNRLRRIDGGII
jgi:hypothetical protein